MLKISTFLFNSSYFLSDQTVVHTLTNKTDACLYKEQKNKEEKTTYLREMGFLFFSDSFTYLKYSRERDNHRDNKGVFDSNMLESKEIFDLPEDPLKDLVGHFSEKVRVYLALYNNIKDGLSFLNP